MLRFELDNQEVVPEDVNSFAFALDENGQIALASDKIVFNGLGAKITRKWIDDGKLFKKLPFKIWEDGIQMYNGFLDLQEDLKIHGDRSVEVKAQSRAKIAIRINEMINQIGPDRIICVVMDEGGKFAGGGLLASIRAYIYYKES